MLSEGERAGGAMASSCGAASRSFTVTSLSRAALAAVLLAGFSTPSAVPATMRFVGPETGMKFACDDTTPADWPAVALLGEGVGTAGLNPSTFETYAFELSAVSPPVGPEGRQTIAGAWGYSHERGREFIIVVPENRGLAGALTAYGMLTLSGVGVMQHLTQTEGEIARCNFSWIFEGQAWAFGSYPPLSPASGWTRAGQSSIEVSARRSTGNAPLWVRVTPCAAGTTCFAAPGTTRADLLVRVLPLPGGRQGPAYLPLTATSVDVWSRRLGQPAATARVWRLAGPGSSLHRPGIFDLVGYRTTGSGAVTDEIEESAEADVLAEGDETLGEEIETLAEEDSALEPVVASADPPPPASPWLTTSTLPGFRFKARLAAAVLVKANACPAQAICLAKTASGPPEIVVRILPKQSNGKRWSILGKFANAEAGVWVEQTARRALKYYTLGARPADSPELLGIVDRQAFAP
jgi:hypothetical protein